MHHKSKMPIKRRRPSIFVRLFTRKPSSHHHKNPARRSNFSRNVLPKIRFVVVALLLIGLAGALVYVSVRTIVRIKSSSTSAHNKQITLEDAGEDVIGIKGVPAFPGAEFMFERDIKSDVVQRFLASGKSAYSLPADTEWDTVVKFYKKHLDELGWQYVMSVPLGDETRLFGEYWVKPIKKAEPLNTQGSQTVQNPADSLVDPTTNQPIPAPSSNSTPTTTTPSSNTISASSASTGLRIYSRLDAVWFEKITPAQAISGLSEQVAKEKEIDMLLSLGSAKELPRSFPWILKFPAVWQLSVSKSRILELNTAEFTGSETGTTVILEPIDMDISKDLEVLGRRLVDDVNRKLAAGDKFVVVSVTQKKVAKQNAVVISLSAGSETGFVCVVPNPQKRIVYAIETYTSEEAFFNYVIDSIKVRE